MTGVMMNTVLSSLLHTIVYVIIKGENTSSYYIFLPISYA